LNSIPDEPDTGSNPRALPPLSKTKMFDARRSVVDTALCQSLEVDRFRAGQLNETIEVNVSNQQLISHKDFAATKKKLIKPGNRIISRSSVKNKM
jgi:hypothetical protein